jgi:hypothetical protein
VIVGGKSGERSKHSFTKFRALDLNENPPQSKQVSHVLAEASRGFAGDDGGFDRPRSRFIVINEEFLLIT